MGLAKIFEWTTIIGASALFLALSIISAIILYQINYPLASASGNNNNNNFETIKVVAHQFYWEFKYPNGTTAPSLKIKANQMYLLEITSADVIHSFFIPELGLKQDAYPNYTTRIWLNITQPGIYHVYCTEYCGTGHHTMITIITVVS
ncbi:MAG: cytochrome c oxidase subunit II [Thermoproteota archaeon]|jgi:heme/copper-type cytochrome/quinol oxidase subunit 2|nr:cytochrome c oxidase subunit II [Thermoproteota archaeon]